MPIPEVKLAKDVGLLLEPYLPALLDNEAAPEGDAGFAEYVGFAKAQRLWDRIKGYPPVMDAAEDLLTDRRNTEKQGTLRFRIKNEFEAHPALFAALQAPR